jgi:hypothetical protein
MSCRRCCRNRIVPGWSSTHRERRSRLPGSLADERHDPTADRDGTAAAGRATRRARRRRIERRRVHLPALRNAGASEPTPIGAWRVGPSVPVRPVPARGRRRPPDGAVGTAGPHHDSHGVRCLPPTAPCVAGRLPGRRGPVERSAERHPRDDHRTAGRIFAPRSRGRRAARRDRPPRGRRRTARARRDTPRSYSYFPPEAAVWSTPPR